MSALPESFRQCGMHFAVFADEEYFHFFWVYCPLWFLISLLSIARPPVVAEAKQKSRYLVL